MRLCGRFHCTAEANVSNTLNPQLTSDKRMLFVFKCNIIAIIPHSFLRTLKLKGLAFRHDDIHGHIMRLGINGLKYRLPVTDADDARPVRCNSKSAIEVSAAIAEPIASTVKSYERHNNNVGMYFF